MKIYIHLILALVLFPDLLAFSAFGQPRSDIVAIVNGTKVLQQDIEPFLPIDYASFNPDKLYAVQKVAVENYIITFLLQAEARRQRISVPELRKRMTQGKVDVPDSKVEEEYVKNARFLGLMSPDEAKERLRLDLEAESRIQIYKSGVAKLKMAATIEITPTKLEQPRPQLDEPGPSRGPHDARVTITEFSDFQCPYCRESHEILKQIVSEYESEVRLVFKHFPLSNKGLSYSSSIASSCADQQDGFWEYHDALFESKVLSPIFLRQIAMKLGLDVDEFERCTAAEATRDLVSQDLAEGKKLGINGTPTFIVNGKIYRGKLDVAEFKKIIELELWSSREDSDRD